MDNIVQTQPTSAVTPHAKAVDFKDDPVACICPACGASITTQVEHHIGCTVRSRMMGV